MQQGSFRALLTGDLEEHGEQELIYLYNKQLANMTVLKAGHHGSKTSSIEPFVELLRPELTIFSAGLHNRYRHPHAEIVERFTSRNLATLTTGIDGTIEVRIRGNSWSVQREKTLSNEQGLFPKYMTFNYLEATSTTIAMRNISANIPKDTPKPTAESVASLRRHCMFFLQMDSLLSLQFCYLL